MTVILGTPEQATRLTHGRHPGVQTALAWLCFSHLPEPLQNFARPLYQTAVELIVAITEDSAELTTALDKLVEAKDWTVRAGIRSSQGHPGPVPRPAVVVDPPLLPGPPRAGEAQFGNYGSGAARPHSIGEDPRA